MTKNNQPKITGFTLIELLISMVLSLFLIGGVISIYVSSQKTAHMREELSGIDDNGRAAIRALTHYIEHAGYATMIHRPLSRYIVGTGEVINSGVCGLGSNNLAGGSIVDGSNTNDSHDGVAPAADRITVVALADGLPNGISNDCSGQALRAECLNSSAEIYNSFYITTPAGETEPSLFCNGSVGANPVRLAEGVEDMQIKYGVDTLRGDLVADQYLDANAMAGLWQSVVSVQIAILVSSIKNVKTSNEAHRYLLLDRAVVKNDRKQYGVFTTEIRLRNVLL